MPLVIMSHDDKAYSSSLPASLRPWAERNFGDAYRFARQRICISEPMMNLYERRYGVGGSVLYPLRDRENPLFEVPAPQTYEQRPSLTFGYAGSIHGESSLRQVVAFADQAHVSGHRVLVYSPQHADLRRLAPHHPAIDARPIASSAELIRALRSDVDCLLVTASFDPLDAELVTTLFPSKVADYSAIGLPLLVWAPPYSSISSFARTHSGLAEVVSDASQHALGSAMMKLASSPHLRIRLATGLLRAGQHVFSPDAAWASFARQLITVVKEHGDGPQSATLRQDSL